MRKTRICKIRNASGLYRSLEEWKFSGRYTSRKTFSIIRVICHKIRGTQRRDKTFRLKVLSLGEACWDLWAWWKSPFPVVPAAGSNPHLWETVFFAVILWKTWDVNNIIRSLSWLEERINVFLWLHFTEVESNYWIFYRYCHCWELYGKIFLQEPTFPLWNSCMKSVTNGKWEKPVLCWCNGEARKS